METGMETNDDRAMAAKVLREVGEVGKVIEKRVSYSIVAPILIVWGVVWMACFTVVHFWPGIAGWTWLVGDGVGIAATIYFGWFHWRVNAVVSEESKRISRRLFWFWFSLFIFADIWLAVLWPWRGVQLGVFGVTLIMFAYVVMGLWLGMWLMVWLGITVTVFTCVGYAVHLYVDPGYINLWLAVCGGGALLVAGLYLMKYRRPAHAEG